MDVEDRSPVQETSRNETSYAMDSGSCIELHLSIEESPSHSIRYGPQPKVYKGNNPTSAESCEVKTLEANVEVTLDGNSTTENCGEDPKPSTANGQDPSVNLNGNVPEAGTKDDAIADLQEEEALKMNNDDVPIVPVSRDSTTDVFQENNFVPEDHRANIRATKVSESRHDGDEGYRPGDQELFVHHEVSNDLSAASQTDGDASDFRIDGGSTIEAYTTTTGGKMNSDGNTDQHNPIDSERLGANTDGDFTPPNVGSKRKVSTSPKDETSTDQGGDGNGFPTENKRYKKSHRRRSSKVCNPGKVKGLISGFLVSIMMIIPTHVQASPVLSQWFRFKFNMTNKCLNNLYVPIRNMETRDTVCTANLTESRFYHNCSESQSWLFAENGTVMLMTKENSTNGFNMECGNNSGVQATYVGELSDKEVSAKIDRYRELSNSPTSVTTDPPNSPTSVTGGCALGCILGIVAVIALLGHVLLYYFCPAYRSKVDSVVSRCRGHGTNRTPENGTNRTPEPDTNRTSKTGTNPDPSAMHLLDRPPTNGNINGQVPTEEDQEEVV